MQEFITISADETINLGERIGKTLKPKDIIALTGQLGSGKTTLIKGIARSQDIPDYDVTSPTFTLINEYYGTNPFYHIDLYRLEEISEIEELGIFEYFKNDGIILIEWAEKLGNLMPKNAHEIKIEYLNENERKIWLSSELAARLG